MTTPALNVPVRFEVDCCFIGGTSAAIAAAATAARAGRRVVVLAERPYLGDDLTATFRLRCAQEDLPRTDLARDLFGTDGRRRPTPMAAKARFDDELERAGVPFLYGCYPAAALRSETGIAGIVVASRSGLFAVRARIVVDATWRAVTARLAGLAFTAFPDAPLTFERVTVGGSARHAPGLTVTTDDEPVVIAGKQGEQSYAIHRYRMAVPMADASPRSFAAADVQLGAATFDPGMVRASDALWCLPPDPIAPGPQHLSRWHDEASLDAFRTADEGLWILGPCADLSRAAAADLVRPASFLAAGERVGTALAAACATRPMPTTVSAAHAGARPLDGDTLRTEQDPLRSDGLATVAVPTDRAPQLDTVDVLVMGGGTAGASAGIAAARHGARTLICEYQPALGGVGTVGMIASYYFGNRVGFTAEIDAGTRAMGPWTAAAKPAHHWNIEWKQRWYQFAAEQSGACVWLGAIGCGAVVSGGVIRGVLVATPYGLGVVRCRTVVDASGNADVAAHAGGRCESIGADHVAMQGTGLGPRQPGHQYRNTDWTFIDDCDVVDTTHAMVIARRKFRQEFDLSTLVDSRERRRIMGESTASPLDFLAKRTFPDTIATANSNFDTHGFTIHPLFMVKPPDKAAMDAHISFRSLLPRDLTGIAVTGLGKSAHRDALPVIRMQPDVQNEGYAMGTAAAMAARSDGDLRRIDIKALQAHLVQVGILAEDVPSHVDSFPIAPERIAEAVRDGTDTHLGLAILFAHPEQARPLLREALGQASDPTYRLRLAQILGLLGDGTGAAILAQAIAAQPWDAGWNFKGMGQFNRSMSPLDDLIVALGRSGARVHAEVILDKIRALTPESAMSHHRAVAEACESLHLTEAAPLLAAVLQLPGIRGHHQHDLAAATAVLTDDSCDTITRNVSLRELHLARALARLGDHQGLGIAVLEAYARDLRGLFARHARAVLAEVRRRPAAMSG